MRIPVDKDIFPEGISLYNWDGSPIGLIFIDLELEEIVEEKDSILSSENFFQPILWNYQGFDYVLYAEPWPYTVSGVEIIDFTVKIKLV